MSTIPTLGAGTQHLIRTPAAQAAYILQFYFNNPGDISETFPEMISFKTDESNLVDDAALLAERVQTVLGNTMQTVIGKQVIVEVNPSFPHDNGGYRLNIAATTTDGVSLLNKQIVSVDADGNLKLHMEERS